MAWFERALLRTVLGGVVVMSLIAQGCAPVGPQYTAPENKVPERWHAQETGPFEAANLSEAVLAQWWKTFDDPILTEVESRVLQANRDLKVAVARVREARAVLGTQRADLFPSLNAAGQALRQRTSAHGTASRAMETGFYRAGFDAGWELDLFGGTRRAVEAALADWEAAQAAHDAVRASLMAEAALAYVELRTFQERLDLTRRNIAVQEETYELNLSRYEAGLIDELPVQQSLYNLEHTRAAVAPLEAGLEAAKNRLAVLAGKEPGTLEKVLGESRPIPSVPPRVAVGIPAEALRNRPDIRLAERNLAAATARIGQASAELYPKFRLVGTIGLESLRAPDLLEWASRFWTIGPAVQWRLFDAGKIRQTIEVRTAQQEQALLRYESTLLNALEEVENTLVAFAKEQRRLEQLNKAVEAAQKAAFRAGDRYQAGLVDFTDVLDAQRTLQNFQDERAQSRGAVTANLIRLYKALGGGWQPSTSANP
ncbi:efflux transporter outer membrane subunit [Desulfosoma caldarium]|nr:efflux transporter outer membrane subunit [Desulfosoma caldarium]